MKAQDVIESTVLAFQRERIQEGVHLARIAIRPGETSTPHYHPATQDVFYVMSGVLTVAVEVNPGVTVPPYRSLCVASPEVVHSETGKEIHRVRLQPGELLTVSPLAVHCTSNTGDMPCSFLCIEGVGEYKFIQAPASHTASP